MILFLISFQAVPIPYCIKAFVDFSGDEFERAVGCVVVAAQTTPLGKSHMRVEYLMYSDNRVHILLEAGLHKHRFPFCH